MPSCSGASPATVSPITLTLDEVSASPEEKAKARKEAREFFNRKIPAKKAAPGARKVTRLRWHKTMKQAVAAAAKADKPVLWIQALGDVKGFT